MKIKKLRIIPRLDVKGPNIVKGIKLEGLRIVGNPTDLAKKYYEDGADEILYIDIVASLYERNSLLEIIKKTVSKGIFIPVTVGGGIRKIEDIREILRAGADKVAINTAATRKPEFITEAAKIFGSQCIVGSIEAKFKDGKWEAYVDNGRETTGIDAVKWARKLVDLGAGELLITSVDRDGTKKGFDIDLLKQISEKVNVPVIGCSGAGNPEDVLKCLQETRCDAAALASILHYNQNTISEIKKLLSENNIETRKQSLVSSSPSSKEKKSVTIIDYGVGNLMSVVSAFEYLGNEIKIVSKGEDVQNSELLVLPGDGAFGYGMEQLKERGFLEAIQKHVDSGKPLLGICLGMQLLMSSSVEFGSHEGLNLIEGTVEPFETETFRIPHMGWNNLKKPSSITWENTLLQNVPEDSEAYFVHSFKVKPKNQSNILATTNYADQDFCSIIQKDNIYGTQFHPEKSGQTGMSILSYFSEL